VRWTAVRSGQGARTTAQRRAPIVGLVAGGPQPFVRRVEDRVPAIQTPHPLDQNEVRTAFQQDHGAPAGDNLEEDDAKA